MRGVGRALQQAGHTAGILIAVLYLGFGLADMFFSMTAFDLGVPEANPVMAWLFAHDLFLPGKTLLTAIVAVLIVVTYPAKRARPAAWAALLVTAGVDVYHLWGLSLV